MCPSVEPESQIVHEIIDWCYRHVHSDTGTNAIHACHRENAHRIPANYILSKYVIKYLNCIYLHWNKSMADNKMNVPSWK